MQTIENTPEKLIIRGEISETIANALRRSVTEIPTLAISDVEIFKNDSALYDEVLAHRLGLLPLKTEKSMDEKTKIEFKLSAKGPSTVYASELEGAAEVLYPKIPLTILGENHKLELLATAQLGKGIDHAKHTPGLCFYRHLLEIKSSPKVDQIVQNSKGAIKPEKKGQKWIADLTELEAHEVEQVDKEAISASKEILLFIESYGSLSAQEILQGASKALVSNLDNFEDNLK